MTPRERAIRLRLRDDFEYYAPRCLKIRTKNGAINPFRLNAAQIYLHGQLEQQRKKTGKVRALVLKGRQQGCSTYTEGRFFPKTTHRRGTRAYYSWIRRPRRKPLPRPVDAIKQLAQIIIDRMRPLCLPVLGQVGVETISVPANDGAEGVFVWGAGGHAAALALARMAFILFNASWIGVPLS